MNLLGNQAAEAHVHQADIIGLPWVSRQQRLDI